jgi:hypothetical protein
MTLRVGHCSRQNIEMEPDSGRIVFLLRGFDLVRFSIGKPGHKRYGIFPEGLRGKI